MSLTYARMVSGSYKLAGPERAEGPVPWPLAAFSLVLPMTLVVLAGVVLVMLSYREVVSVYTRERTSAARGRAA